MTQSKALEILTRAGYDAKVEGETIIVQDAYCGYNSGKYAVDGYTPIRVRPAAVFKFIADRS